MFLSKSSPETINIGRSIFQRDEDLKDVAKPYNEERRRNSQASGSCFAALKHIEAHIEFWIRDRVPLGVSVLCQPRAKA